MSEKEVKEIRIDTGENIFTATICGRTYRIRGYISFNDYDRSFQIESNPDISAEDILNGIVLSHIVSDGTELPSEEEVGRSGAVSEYIEIVLRGSDKIRSKYDLHSEIEDQARRFLLSVNENARDELKGLGDALKNIKLPKMELPGKLLANARKIDFSKAFGDFSPALTNLQALANSFAKVAVSNIQMQSVTEAISDSIRELVGAQQAALKTAFDELYKSLPNMAALSISGERIEEIRKAQVKWGNYGWTIPKHARITDFFNEPVDKKEADRIGRTYCSAKQMEELFEETFLMDKVKASVFQEAVANFRDRRYRSCAMILFSLIDALFIKMMKDEDRNGRGRRPVGGSAAQKALKRVKAEQIDDRWYLAIFRCENLLACLNKMFEDGKDFKSQPDVINRNFLDHGMTTRGVKRRDCVQLFLLYYNILDFFEMIED